MIDHAARYSPLYYYISAINQNSPFGIIMAPTARCAFMASIALAAPGAQHGAQAASSIAATSVNYQPVAQTGWIVDNVCYDNSAATDWVAPDGSRPAVSPENHTVWCNLLNVCVRSGYSMLHTAKTGGRDYFERAFTFGNWQGTGNQAIVTSMNAANQQGNFKALVIGFVDKAAPAPAGVAREIVDLQFVEQLDGEETVAEHDVVVTPPGKGGLLGALVVYKKGLAVDTALACPDADSDSFGLSVSSTLNSTANETSNSTASCYCDCASSAGGFGACIQACPNVIKFVEIKPHTDKGPSVATSTMEPRTSTAEPEVDPTVVTIELLKQELGGGGGQAACHVAEIAGVMAVVSAACPKLVLSPAEEAMIFFSDDDDGAPSCVAAECVFRICNASSSTFTPPATTGMRHTVPVVLRGRCHPAL